jgi:NADH-quinone oxidoreductase subunit F
MEIFQRAEFLKLLKNIIMNWGNDMVQEMRIALRNLGKIDPLNIHDYLKRDGYKALKKTRAMKQIDIIEEVKKANLRGRGGAGFNAGTKWSFAFNTKSEQKYIVCNADEGEPGTYKDRVIMENDPHSLIEGMAICGYATGIDKGFIYCRGEYAKSAEILKEAIHQARKEGLLENFDIEVRMGAGAYICGEETALIESIEGRRGEPRYKPPFPPIKGLWGKPTIVNNVETFAKIPVILDKGSSWFSSIGSNGYPGTKILTLSGDVVRKSFVEVPTNTTLREVINNFGGGVVSGRKLKAVQVGGSSGAFIPVSMLDTCIDFDSMSKIGATLGSGAVFVLDETRDIVDVTESITDFFKGESCGKCTPCREGTLRMHEILAKINQGSGSNDDLEQMETLGNLMSGSCFCGLGQAAPVPVLTSMKYFKAEYFAKIQTNKEREAYV